MKAKRAVVITTLLGLVLTTSFLFAQAPNLLNYQGKLNPSPGAGTVNLSMTFSIYTAAPGGTASWTETRNVPVTNGVFSELLGSVTPFPSDLFTGAGDRYLGIKVGSDPEMTPRFRLASVVFAIRASQADGVADNAITGRKIANSEVVRSVNNLKDNVTLNAGANITITPSGNNLTIAATGGGGGDITAVNASTGLTGGGASGDVTVALNTVFTDGQYVNENQVNSISNVMIQTGAVTGSKIATSTVTSTNIADNAIGSAELQDAVAFGSASVNGFVQTYSQAAGRIVTTMSSNTNNGGFLGLRNSADRETIRMTGIGSGINEAGILEVYNSGGTRTAGINGSNGQVFGASKSFIVADPQRSDRMIQYTCPEGPEAAIYVRGKVSLVGGRAFIDFPDHFSAMAVASSITVTLTPRSADSKGLAAIDVSEQGIQVAELNGGTGNYVFDYFAYAVRKGYENYQVYINAPDMQGANVVAPQKQ